MPKPLPPHIVIRQAQINDAEPFVELMNTLDSETEYLLFEPGERQLTVEEQRRRLERDIDSNNRHILVAENSNTKILLGFCGGSRGIFQREQHIVNLAIAVRQEYSSQGIGTALLQSLIQWSQQQSIHRLSLGVSEGNHIAISTYENLGFEKEGLLRDGIKLKSGYVNKLIMGLLLP